MFAVLSTWSCESLSTLDKTIQSQGWSRHLVDFYVKYFRFTVHSTCVIFCDNFIHVYICIHIYLYFFRMLLISYFVHKLLQHFTQLCTYSLSCDGPGPSIPMRLSAFRAFALDRGSASLRSRNHGKNAERNIWKKIHEKMWKSIERWGNVRCIVMLAELISGENQSYVTPFIARFIACLHSKIFPNTWPACRHFLCRQA